MFKQKSLLQFTRQWVAPAAVVFSLAANLYAGPQTYAIHIAGQEAGAALMALARETGVQIIVPQDVGENVQVATLQGEYTLSDALDSMLKGTGLAYEITAENVVLVKMAAVDAKSSQSSTEKSRSRIIEEVVVTAQKRKENLQDVPISVTALNAQTLIDGNLLRLQDYYHKVPGLNFVQVDGDAPIIAIRGIVMGGQSNPTVAHVIDDVPHGATVNPGSSPYSPDIDPADLAGIEVLRGPQGTLYGASSLGGLIKYVTRDPSPEGFSGRVQAGTSSVSHGSDLGHSLRGSVNVPLGDTLAFQASGFTREEPGYIDNLASGERDVNNTEAEGGRLSVLWRPSDEFSVKLGALVQETKRGGPSTVDLSLGGLANQNLIGTGTLDREIEAYTATITARLGRADLVSVTGYTVDELQIIGDISPFFGSSVSSLAILPTKKLTQEVRVTLPIGERVQWLLGAFYTDEDRELLLDWLATDSVTGAVTGNLFDTDGPSTFEEYAAFTNLTLEVTERFDIQVGGRYMENKQSFSRRRAGPFSVVFFGADPFFQPGAKSKDSAFTYLLTPRWKISPDFMVYARLASGYRPGGGNSSCTTTFPCEYSADTTRNYDIGLKGSFFDQKLSVDASLYYIDWKDIQVPLIDTGTGLPFTDNVSEATSQGVEFSVQAQPLQGLSLSAWVAYNDAVLEDTLPPSSGRNAVAGDRLPYSSRWSGNLSIEQGFPLWGDVTGYVGGTVSYVGDREAQFPTPSVARTTFPAYTQWDLHAGMEYGTWTLSAFLNNVTDKRAVLSIGSEFFFPNLATYIQPRTLGVSIAKAF